MHHAARNAPRLIVVSILALLAHAAPLIAQERTPRPTSPVASPELRAKLAAAAASPDLAPWQRDLMLEVADGGGGAAPGGTAAPQPALAPLAVPDPIVIGRWMPFSAPSARYYASSIYDPLRHRMVVFGGFDAIGRRNDVWELTLAGAPAWNLLPVQGAPPSPRYGQSAIYDSVRDRMIVFGGSGFTDLNDAWALSFGSTPTWNQLAPSGAPPSPRGYHAAIYDPVRDRMLVFGGQAVSGGPVQNDVWALSFAGGPSWTPLLASSASPPSARTYSTAVYDPVRDRMLMFGGLDGGSSILHDTWALALSGAPAWSPLAPAGGPPATGYLSTTVYDAAHDRLVTFGGADETGMLNAVWTLDLSGTPTWSAFGTTGGPPAPRLLHTAVYDPAGDRLVVFGGSPTTFGLLKDAWALSLAVTPSWTELAPVEIAPAARRGHSAIADPARNRMLVFGGFAASGAVNDLWALDEESRAWTPIAATGTPPATRYAHTAIYDPVRDRMLVFGGRVSLGTSNDLWELSLAGTPTWTPLAPAGAPPPARQNHTAIYDPIRDRMVVYGGGFDSSSMPTGDVWALSLSGSPSWSPLVTSGTPPTARALHSAIYDSAGDRMIVFGGFDGLHLLGDVWSLSFAGSPTWSPLTPSGTPPGVREAHSAIHDPVLERMIVFGGSSNISDLSDTWALSLSGGPVWSKLVPLAGPPEGRVSHSAIYDAPRGRMLVYGGSLDPKVTPLWALAWDPIPPLSVPPSPAHGVTAFRGVTPNPAASEQVFELAVSDAERVQSLDVFDVQGQRLWHRDLRSLAAGPQRVVWDGRTRAGTPLPPGVYLASVRTARGVQTRRIIRLR